MFTYGDKVETTDEYKTRVEDFNLNSNMKLRPYICGRVVGMGIFDSKTMYAVCDQAIEGKYLRKVED